MNAEDTEFAQCADRVRDAKRHERSRFVLESNWVMAAGRRPRAYERTRGGALRAARQYDAGSHATQVAFRCRFLVIGGMSEYRRHEVPSQSCFFQTPRGCRCGSSLSAPLRDSFR